MRLPERGEPWECLCVVIADSKDATREDCRWQDPDGSTWQVRIVRGVAYTVCAYRGDE